MKEALPERTAIDNRRLFDVIGQVLKETQHQPDHKGQGIGDMGQDQGEVGVGDAQVANDDKVGDHRGHRRVDACDQHPDHRCPSHRIGEITLGQGIGGQRPQQDRKAGRT